MTKLKYDRRAGTELEEAIEYYQERSNRAAANFLRAYESSLNYILNFPEGNPVKRKWVRSKALAGFPFTIQYMLYKNIVYIVAVAHQSRHPEYWKERLKDIPE